MNAEGDPSALSKLMQSLASGSAGNQEQGTLPALADSHSHGDPVTAVMIESFLAWRYGEHAAAEAMARLCGETVDFNEARVLLVDELVQVLGPTEPHAEERATRLRRALNAVYEQEHSVSLGMLVRQGKREARVFLDQLDGMVPFVSARVTLLALHGHAFPIDERHIEMLVAKGVLSHADDPAAVSSWMERQFRAGEAYPAFIALDTACHATPPRTRRPGGRGRATNRKRGAKSHTDGAT